MPTQASHLVAHYTFSLADYLALNKAMIRRTLLQRFVLLLIWLGVVLLIMAWVSHDVRRFTQGLYDLVRFHEVPWMMYAFIVIGAIIAIFSDKLTLLRARRFYRWNASAEKYVSFDLSDACIQVTREGFYSRLEWPLIKRVVVTTTHAFLVLSRREALVLPRRAFDNDAEFEAAIALACSQIGGNS